MQITTPWVIGGDFNVILDASEKLGGLRVTYHWTADFAQCISLCALTDLKFCGNNYTWWNGRIEEESIF